MVSKPNSASGKISGSARNEVRVPFRLPWGPIFVTPLVGLPRSYSWAQMCPSRADSTRSHSERAFTTLTPTP